MLYVDEGQLLNLVYLSKSLARFPRCMGDDWKRLWGAYRWSHVDFSSKEGHAKGTDEWQLALTIIHQCLDDTTFEKVTNATTAKQVWEVLQESNQEFENVRKVRLQKLHGDFEKLHMLELENISEYFAKILVIYNQIKRHGEKMEETHMVEKIISLL